MAQCKQLRAGSSWRDGTGLVAWSSGEITPPVVGAGMPDHFFVSYFRIDAADDGPWLADTPLIWLPLLVMPKNPQYPG